MERVWQEYHSHCDWVAVGFSVRQAEQLIESGRGETDSSVVFSAINFSHISQAFDL